MRDEGLLNIPTLSTKNWYSVLLENNLLMITDDLGRRVIKPCRAEINNPDVDWPETWRLASLRGLSSEDQSFLWKMLHNLLPTQVRLHRLRIKNTPTPNCIHCDSDVPDQLQHALVTCPQNKEVSDWLLQQLQYYVPSVTPQKLVLLSLVDLQGDHELPIVWFISQVLGNIWSMRVNKKKPQLYQTRSVLEAGIAIMRKSRLKGCCDLLETIIGS